MSSLTCLKEDIWKLNNSKSPEHEHVSPESVPLRTVVSPSPGVLMFSLDCRAAEGSAGGIRQQALPRPGEDCQEPEEGGADPGPAGGLEGGHRRGDRVLRRTCGVHPVLVSNLASPSSFSGTVKLTQ